MDEMDLESPGSVRNHAGPGAHSDSKAADVVELAAGYHAIQKT